jgi:D-alanyl-D-alanine dipeptidase
MLYKESYRELKKKMRICDREEKMVPLPKTILRFTPHPYQNVGATYNFYTPFYVREGVLKRLLQAQKLLSQKENGYHLKIFDAYRPLSVQVYMIEYDKNEQALKRYKKRFIDLEVEEQRYIEKKVNSFWSPIADDVVLNPPPHSTGGAVDLSICDSEGIALAMGTEIDALVEESSARYFDNTNTIYEKNRALLQEVMLEVGFTQLPTEWWHFSYGDQLWAVDNKQECAIYGLVEGV